MNQTWPVRLDTASFACVALLGACSASGSVGIGSKEVSQSDVESQVASQLAAETNQPTPTVSCPSGLAAKVGTTLDCTLTPKGGGTSLPVHVVVDSVANGTAHFTAQVSQAPGGGDKAAFCSDNSTLDKAFGAAKQPSDVLPILKANKSLIDDFRMKAPADIINDAGTMAKGATDAINANDPTAITTPEFAAAGKAVDTYCGQNPDGSPIAGGASPTTAAP